jgi:hypothetical protein
MAQTSFGRRTTTKIHTARPPVMTKFVRPGDDIPPSAAILTEPAQPSVEDELKEWKKTRGFTFPLKTVAVMASICFGIGSVALPDDVNEWAQWPLFALSAASLYVGFRRKAAPRV